MKILRSYVGGRWVEGTGARATLLTPATEEPLAEAGAGGIDWAAALAHARTAGASVLSQLTFAQRGEILRALSRLVHAHRDELIALAIANGGHTRGDAKVDVDRPSGPLAAHAQPGAH